MTAGKRLKIMWWLTGLAVLILLVSTVALYVRADRIRDSGIVAYVTRSQAAPFLRDRPGNNGTVLTVLEYGTRVLVSDSTTNNSQDWYFVDTGDMSGWLPASLISFDLPEPGSQVLPLD